MKLLLCSDVHLDSPFVWAGPRVGSLLRAALRDAVQQIVQVAAAEQVDALCVAGDLFEHEYATADTGAFLQSVFGSLNCPVLLAPGNHDWLGPASLYSRVAWPANVHLFASDRLEAYELTAGFTVWGAAHRAPANTDGFLECFRPRRSGLSVALFHGSARDDLGGQGAGKVPHAPFSARQVEASGLAHALVGHYHRPVHGRHHTYAGNPEPLSFGEDGTRGPVLLTFSGADGLHRVVRPVASRTWDDVVVEIDAARHAAEVREQVRAELADRCGLVRLTVSGTCAPHVAVDAIEFSDLGPHLDALVVRPPRLTAAYDLAALAAEPTVRGSFVRDVLASDLDSDMVQRVLSAGLLALDGRASELVAR